MVIQWIIVELGKVRDSRREEGKVDRRGNRRDENDLGVRMVPGVAIEKCKAVNRDFGKEMIGEV